MDVPIPDEIIDINDSVLHAHKRFLLYYIMKIYMNFGKLGSVNNLFRLFEI